MKRNRACSAIPRSFERQAILLLSLLNNQSRSHRYLLFSNDCLRKANNFQFRSHKSVLLKNDFLTRENDFPFCSHGDFMATCTSWLHASEQLVVRNVFV